MTVSRDNSRRPVDVVNWSADGQALKLLQLSFERRKCLTRRLRLWLYGIFPVEFPVLAAPRFGHKQLSSRPLACMQIVYTQATTIHQVAFS